MSAIEEPIGKILLGTLRVSSPSSSCTDASEAYSCVCSPATASILEPVEFPAAVRVSVSLKPLLEQITQEKTTQERTTQEQTAQEKIVRSVTTAIPHLVRQCLPTFRHCPPLKSQRQ